jgi:hypothetical protein
LSSYRFEIIHTPGKKLGHADALSRRSYPPPKGEPSTFTIQPEIYAIESSETNEAKSSTWTEYTFVYPTTPLDSGIKQNVLNAEDTPPVQEEDPLSDTDFQERVQQIMTANTVDMKTLQAQDEQLGPYIKYIQDATLPQQNTEARKIILEAQDFFIDENGILFH